MIDSVNSYIYEYAKIKKIKTRLSTLATSPSIMSVVL